MTPLHVLGLACAVLAAWLSLGAALALNERHLWGRPLPWKWVALVVAGAPLWGLLEAFDLFDDGESVRGKLARWRR